jgi:hypothetical protein
LTDEVRGLRRKRTKAGAKREDEEPTTTRSYESLYKMGDVDFDVDELENMAYRDIQSLCKQLGIRANQKVRPCCHHPYNCTLTWMELQKAVLIDLLRDHHVAHASEYVPLTSGFTL